MININYRVEESDDNLVLVSQISGGKSYKVVGVHPETKQLELNPSFPGTGRLEFSRINDLDAELLKKHFPESYI